MFQNVRNCRVRVIKFLRLLEVSSYDYDLRFYIENARTQVLPNFLISQAAREENMKNCSPGLVCSTK